jgi:hypothetical protein
MFDINDDYNFDYFERKTTPWYNHPACKMWRGYENSLGVYGLIICATWKERGFKDSIYEKIGDIFECINWSSKPPWFGNQEFHGSHKSNLLRKDYEHYKQFNWNVPPGLSYVWPVK